MPEHFKNIIFTKHALARMDKRSISFDKIWSVINHPDKSFKRDNKSKKFIKKINDRNYHAIATYLPDEEKFLIISAWVRGEDDKQSFIWILLTLPFRIGWWIIKKIFKFN